jgi:hypothetical protein
MGRGSGRSYGQSRFFFYTLVVSLKGGRSALNLGIPGRTTPVICDRRRSSKKVIRMDGQEKEEGIKQE